MNKSKLKQVATVTGLFLGAFAISVLAAGEWTPAPCEAPQCNASAPINVSPADQTKAGSLTVGGSLSVSGAKVTASGASLDVNGFGLFTGLNISGMTSTNQITVLENGANTQNYVLTNKGGGVGEWKAPAGGNAQVALDTDYCYATTPGRGVRFGGLKGYYLKGLTKLTDDNWDSYGGVFCLVSGNTDPRMTNQVKNTLTTDQKYGLLISRSIGLSYEALINDCIANIAAYKVYANGNFICPARDLF